jgi:alpha-1,2-mannosyltransferase
MGKTYGFFHPYCNAGGGGERVLWQAVKDTLKRDETGQVIIYTGDTDAAKKDILSNALDKFDILIDETRVDLIYLKGRWLVDSKTWPVLTLLGQAIGSMMLAFEAINKFQPDVWVDTMGYPFSYPVVWFWLPIPIVTYTHFPVISKDMLNKLNYSPGGIRQWLKFLYWSGFMIVYTIIGNFVDIGITNSTWTYNHISSIWKNNKNVKIIYPPCSTEKLVEESLLNKGERSNDIVVLAQFRPEKRHDLVIEEFSKYLSKKPANPLNLILVGSIRNDQDKLYVKSLEELAKKVSIPEDKVTFVLNAPFSKVTEILNKATFGLNAMWNEHFGIAVVEYMANGLIPVVHASAGPLLDIVVPWNAKDKKQSDQLNEVTRTGFFFKSENDSDFNPNDKYEPLHEVLLKVSELKSEEKLRIVKNGKSLVLEKFSDATFDKEWYEVVDEINDIVKRKQSKTFTSRNILFISTFVLISATLIRTFMGFTGI